MCSINGYICMVVVRQFPPTPTFRFLPVEFQWLGLKLGPKQCEAGPDVICTYSDVSTPRTAHPYHICSVIHSVEQSTLRLHSEILYTAQNYSEVSSRAKPSWLTRHISDVCNILIPCKSFPVFKCSLVLSLVGHGLNCCQNCAHSLGFNSR